MNRINEYTCERSREEIRKTSDLALEYLDDISLFKMIRIATVHDQSHKRSSPCNLEDVYNRKYWQRIALDHSCMPTALIDFIVSFKTKQRRFDAEDQHILDV